LHLRALDAEDQRLYALIGSEVLRLAGDGMDEGVAEEMAELFARYVEVETTAIGTRN
jgi:hypothetical protein